MSTSLHVIPDYTNSLTCCDIDAMLNEKSTTPKPLLMGKTSFDITYSAFQQLPLQLVFIKVIDFILLPQEKEETLNCVKILEMEYHKYQKVHSNYTENLEKTMNKRFWHKTQWRVRIRSAYIGIAQFQIIEVHRCCVKQWPSMPCTTIQLQKLWTRNSENTHIIDSRGHIEMTTVWLHNIQALICVNFAWVHYGRLRNTKIPNIATNWTKALRNTCMIRYARKLEWSVVEMHNVEPKRMVISFTWAP